VENPLNRWALQLYRPVLQWALRARWLVLGGAAGVLLLTLLPLGGLGSEFMPPLNEGSLMYMPNTLPALSLTTQRRLLHVEDSILMTFPEVESVWGKAGPGEHGHRLGADVDGRDRREPEAGGRVATGDDPGSPDRRNGINGCASRAP